MVFSDYTKQRILSMYWQGYRVGKIMEYLVLEDGILSSKQGIRQFLKLYQESGSIARKPGSGSPPKLSPPVQQLIEDVMRSDEETMATQLQAMLASRHIYVALNDREKQVRTGMDLPWLCLLSINTSRKQGETTALGYCSRA